MHLMQKNCARRAILDWILVSKSRLRLSELPGAPRHARGSASLPAHDLMDDSSSVLPGRANLQAKVEGDHDGEG